MTSSSSVGLPKVVENNSPRTVAFTRPYGAVRYPGFMHPYFFVIILRGLFR
nr:hypothetical protein [Sulfolobus sp. NOB8H2]